MEKTSRKNIVQMKDSLVVRDKNYKCFTSDTKKLKFQIRSWFIRQGNVRYLPIYFPLLPMGFLTPASVCAWYGRLGPHRNYCKFRVACVCKAPFKHRPNPAEVICKVSYHIPFSMKIPVTRNYLSWLHTSTCQGCFNHQEGTSYSKEGFQVQVSPQLTNLEGEGVNPVGWS